MANIKISDLTTLAVGDIDIATDVLPIVDTSVSTTKKSTVQAIVDAGLKAPGDIGVTTPGAGTFTALSCTSVLSSSDVIGYASGAGGTVTQVTSITTGVTINKVCGTIVTYNSGATVTAFTDNVFTVTNNKVSAGDIIALCLASVGNAKVFYTVENVLVGSFDIRINVMSDSTTPSRTISFAVINNVTS